MRDRIRDAAEGNPLFVEEMLALARESGEGTSPCRRRSRRCSPRASISSIRPSEECSSAARSRGGCSIAERSGARTRGDSSSTSRLTSLVRKEFIRPDTAQLPGEDAFRFRHLLIRDAAYDSLPKATRADLHERFANWLAQHAAGIAEPDEMLGHHLEQAARYKDDLGHPDQGLAQRAGDQLAAAGRRALWRGDEPAAISLLGRAVELTQPIRLDVALALDLAEALQQDPLRAAETATAAAQVADGGDETAAAVARAVSAYFRHSAGEATPAEVEGLVRTALPLLDEASDHAALARLYVALGQVANARGRWDDWADAAEQAIRHARLAGRSDANLFGLASALAEGPRPADAALQTLDAYLPESARLLRRAELLAQLGRFEEAWSLAQDESERLLDLNGSRSGEHTLAAIAALEGDHEAAARHLRRFCEFLEEHQQRAVLNTHVAELGRELCILGRHEEAEPLARLSRDRGDDQDLLTQVAWRLTEALVRLSHDEHRAAEQLAREAVAISDETDLLNLQATARHDLAEVLAAADRTEEAASALEEALERYERKNNIVMAERTRKRLAALSERTPT